MTSCANCGHEPVSGRFCTNCGHPLGGPAPTDGTAPLEQAPEQTTEHTVVLPVPADGWRASTAERPAVPAAAVPVAAVPVPPPATEPPPAADHDTARFPLFADQVITPVDRQPRRIRGGWLPWTVAALTLVLVAGLGFWLLAGDNQPTASGHPTRTPGSPARPGQPAPAKPRNPEDVAQFATASAPRTAPPNQDLAGNVVRYEARNMLDGVPDTCWRMPGDGTGQEITIRLDRPTTLRKVGLINGYAKVASDRSGRTLDWYRGNRRIRSVQWVFDDGSTVDQRFRDTSDMQTTEIHPVTTSTVRIRIVEVTRPGPGRASRDYTPISDVTLIGAPA